MPIVSMVSTKGGPGKTTLTVCLADFWRRTGRTVTCLDMDPNRNLITWIGGAGLSGITCMAVDEGDIVNTANAAAEHSDIVLIDVAGYLQQGMVYAVGVANMAIIPCRPALGEVIEAGRTQQVIMNASRLLKRAILHAALLTQIDRRAEVTPHTRSQLADFGIPVLESDMASRTVYQRAWYKRCSPLNLQDTKARQEIGAVADEIMRMVSSHA
jgi:chromosome partitioning protein